MSATDKRRAPESAAPPPASPRQEPAPRGQPRMASSRERAALAFGVLGTLILALWFFQSILTPFVLAGVVAYFLDPVATRLNRLGVRRGIAAIALTLGLAAFVLICALLLYPLLLAQIGMLVTRLPSYVARIVTTLRDGLARLEEALGPEIFDAQLRDLVTTQAAGMLSWLGAAATRLIGGGFALFSVFTYAIVTPVVAYYLLRDWPRIITRVESWLPRRNAAVLRQLGRDTDRVLSAWLRGQLICCAILAVYYAVVLSLVGLELGVLIGIMSGILTFIPYVGSMTGFVVAVLLAIGQFGNWPDVGLVMLVFVIGQFVEGYIIYPRLLGDRVELHAVWVIFALFAGGVAFGFLGVLLAVPIAAAIGVVARYWLRRYLESPLYLDPPRTGS